MAITHEELVAHYGETAVVRSTRGQLASFGLPEDAVRGLVEIGLPRRVGADEFVAVPPEPMTAEEMEKAGASGRLVRFGRSQGSAFVVDTDSGVVLAVPPAVDPGPGFVNSSLPQFIECLHRFWTIFHQSPLAHDADDEFLERRAGALVDMIRAVDPAALAHEDTYYSEILLDIRYGVF